MVFRIDRTAQSPFFFDNTSWQGKNFFSRNSIGYCPYSRSDWLPGQYLSIQSWNPSIFHSQDVVRKILVFDIWLLIVFRSSTYLLYAHTTADPLSKRIYRDFCYLFLLFVEDEFCSWKTDQGIPEEGSQQEMLHLRSEGIESTSLLFVYLLRDLSISSWTIWFLFATAALVSGMSLISGSSALWGAFLLLIFRFL